MLFYILYINENKQVLYLYQNHANIFVIGGKKMIIDTNLDDFKLRLAERKDVPLILEFIKELADYEKMLDEVVATEEILTESLFEKKAAEVVIGEYQNKPVAFALFFHNFSTFLGRPGIYLEDLYVKPEMRGKGIGKMMLSFLAHLCVERKCGRLEWWCLDWNEPSIQFYKKMGAVPMDEWTVYRVTGDALDQLAAEFNR
ncbi:MAG: GCN5-related N-acetyltransferase [Defluviitaleaceae bacterium]|jgi:GNAT superfamily N-acetyltransferase|nr:GCN5-related N-acetyltransferase [Defluviitaleaceae bacterium]